MMMTEQEAMKILIIQTALSQLGAHYLNATDGGLPGLKDGIDKKNLKLVDNPDPKNVAIRTVRFNDKSCAGRCDMVGGSTFGKGDSLKMAELEKYCDEIKELQKSGTLPANWKDFEKGLYPRTDVGVFGNKIVLGEDCSNIRHFDCISFVQWVLTNTLRHHSFKQYTFDIVQHEGRKKNDDTRGGVKAPGKRFFPPFSVLQNADILIRINWIENEKVNGEYPNDKKYRIGSKHIGFYMAGGKVVQASGAARGVIISEYNPKSWTSVFRLRNDYLKFG